jgi:hypothetical protein
MDEQKRLRDLEQKQARDEGEHASRRRQAVSRPPGGRRHPVRDVEESGDNVFEKAYFELLRWFHTIRTAHINSFQGGDAGSVSSFSLPGHRSPSESGEESSRASDNGQGSERPSGKGLHEFGNGDEEIRQFIALYSEWTLNKEGESGTGLVCLTGHCDKIRVQFCVLVGMYIIVLDQCMKWFKTNSDAMDAGFKAGMTEIRRKELDDLHVLRNAYSSITVLDLLFHWGKLLSQIFRNCSVIRSNMSNLNIDLQKVSSSFKNKDMVVFGNQLDAFMGYIRAERAVFDEKFPSVSCLMALHDGAPTKTEKIKNFVVLVRRFLRIVSQKWNDETFLERCMHGMDRPPWRGTEVPATNRSSDTQSDPGSAVDQDGRGVDDVLRRDSVDGTLQDLTVQVSKDINRAWEIATQAGDVLIEVDFVDLRRDLASGNSSRLEEDTRRLSDDISNVGILSPRSYEAYNQALRGVSDLERRLYAFKQHYPGLDPPPGSKTDRQLSLLSDPLLYIAWLEATAQEQGEQCGGTCIQ